MSLQVKFIGIQSFFFTNSFDTMLPRSLFNIYEFVMNLIRRSFSIIQESERSLVSVISKLGRTLDDETRKIQRIERGPSQIYKFIRTALFSMLNIILC